MRRSEREERLARLAGRLLGDARRILTLDVPLSLDDREVVQATQETLAALPEDAFEGAVMGIHPGSATRARVVDVCTRLREGAPLLLVAQRRPSVGERARGLLTRTPPPRVPLVDLSSALLLAGLCTPRVHDDVPALLLVSARVPLSRSPLDGFFTQPSLFPQPDVDVRR
ncbi:MAG: hypothetical protein ABW252_20945 [Polyangiales bacterium]